MDYSVSEFAQKKGLSRARIHQLIQANEIKARKVGNQWVIPGQEFDRNPKSARSFSPRMARAFLNYISNLEIDEQLDPAELSRLRRRVQLLKDSEDPANLLRSWLKHRAELVELSANIKDFEKIIMNEKILISGSNNPLSGISGSSILEGYVEKRFLKEIVKQNLLVNSSSPNIKFRVVSKKLPKSLPIGYLLADLSDNYGPREKKRVKELVNKL